MNTTATQEELARDIWDGELYFAEDGQVFEL